VTRPSAPLAACGVLLAALAVVALARPRGAPAPPPLAPSSPAASSPPTSEQRERLLDEEPVDVNAADRDELELLPRIGPTLAERIVEERARGGPFESVAGLTRVRGIGPRTVERLRPLVTVSR